MRFSSALGLSFGLLVSAAACDPKPAPVESSNAPREPAVDYPGEARDTAASTAAQAGGDEDGTLEPQGPESAPGGETRVERPGPGDDFKPVGTEAQRFACTEDADCVLTKWRDGSCCPSLCSAKFALNAEFSERLAGMREQWCDGACPVARCAKPTERYEARCVEDSCVVFSQPIDDGADR